MASKRKAASISTDPTTGDADDSNGRLRTSKRLKQSAFTSQEATGDGKELSNSVTEDLRPKQPQESSLTLPVAVSLTEHTSHNKSSEGSKQEKMRLLDLPLDVLCLVADHLDVVDRTCLRYAHPALGHWSKKGQSNLSACARSRLVNLLKRDGAPIPEELFGAGAKNSNMGECWEYHMVIPKYCVACRCHGHLLHCPECRVRTCAREDADFWVRWTGKMVDDTAVPESVLHSSP